MAVVRDDPYGRFNFLVDLGVGDKDSAAAGFSEVTGLGSEIQYAEYRNGNDRENHVRKVPTLHRTSDVTLRRGVIGDLRLVEWLVAVRQGSIDKRTVVVTLLDEQRNEVLRWVLREVWPRKYVGPALDARSNEVAVEELVLAAEQVDCE